ncbi:hypothetical protein KDX25_06345 [Burkholderia cenocepacia]|uniref:hypothetical protein n=1 Tax=Burkholderia cenocepacia TaxID=95486 RepID=UPI000F55F3C4|nr:hypothetical protein [Burkholderia cenocepacia]MBR8306027.1 hypothetical protein [Burkholderia cenocepacia]
MVHRLVSVGTVEKTGVSGGPIGPIDLPPGFCMKNIGMKLLQKSAEHIPPATNALPQRADVRRGEWA